jgi:hypothetical protein
LFLIAFLGYTAIMAKDGRNPVTDWLDPMLAGLTILGILFIQLVLMIVWDHIDNLLVKLLIGRGLLASQWFYIR